MGLCKCPKRKVTNQFCFEHRVNVCEHCMVNSHKKVCFLQFFIVSFFVLRRTERWYEIDAFLLIGTALKTFLLKEQKPILEFKIWTHIYWKLLVFSTSGLDTLLIIKKVMGRKENST